MINMHKYIPYYITLIYYKLLFHIFRTFICSHITSLAVYQPCDLMNIFNTFVLQIPYL